jgi:putative ABC transport system permease protein
MSQIRDDLRFGIRMLFKHKTLSVISILTFGLGIGLSTTVFSIVNGVLFKGFPVDRPDQIVTLFISNEERNIQRNPVSVHDFVDWQEQQKIFENFGAWSVVPLNLAFEGERPERYSAGAFSVGIFETLAVKPLLGRWFRKGEDRPGAEPAILIGERIWRDRFGSSPDIIGKSIRANGSSHTIIGVMPESFPFPNREELWVPLQIDPAATKRGEGPSYIVVGRLRDGITAKEASAQAAAIGMQLEREYPESNRAVRFHIQPYIKVAIGPEVYAVLFTMLGAGIGVLLIACVNVSNLLLARISLRLREVSVRVAMGASRSRVIVQLLTEVLVLAFAGAAVGMAFSDGAMSWFLGAIAVNPPPRWISFDLDIRVMLFVVLMTLGASLVSGLIPALQATRANITEVLKDETRGASGFRMSRLTGALVVAEVAVSCGLLIGAGLMVKSIIQLKTLNLPFAVERIFTARINLPRLQYPDSAACIRFYEQLLPKLEEIPGVESATLSDGLPAAGNGTVAFQVEGLAYARENDYPVAREGIVTPGYFPTFQTRLLRGRDFTAADRPGKPAVAIVNESFARKFFPNADPLGRRFRKGRGVTANEWLNIVGLVPDMLMQGLGNNDQSPAGYYIPIAQSDVTNFVSIALRTRGEPSAVTQAVRTAVVSLDKDLAIYQVLSMKEVLKLQSWFYTVFGTFFMVFGCTALFLAVAGLYGVMSFAVSQRTREMGIRMALGARGSKLVLLTMRRGSFQLALGLTIGFVLAMFAVGPLRGILYKVDVRDPLVLTVVPIVLAAAGLLASLLPARRVTKIDPVSALTPE